MKIMSYAILFLFMSASLAAAAGSPSMQASPSKDVKYYNQGVELMMQKRFDRAERQFRKALAANAQFAEAHNNLAYTLRKQGTGRFDEALKHYNRAIELDPGLNEPYMYRGVLHMQMGNRDMALSDHRLLVARNSPLAAELQYVVDNGREKEPERFFGVNGKIDG